VCRKAFQPDPRVGARQRTCGAAECRRQHKRGQQRRWARRNRGYWSERRLRAQAEKLAALSDRELEGAPGLRAPPEGLSKLPAAFVRSVLGNEGLVIVLLLARVQHRAAKTAQDLQESARHVVG